MQIVAVLNPHARSGNVMNVEEDLRLAAAVRDVDLIVRQTRSPTEIRSVVQKFNAPGVVFLIAGGDGSVQQMVNVLMRESPTSKLAVFPCGTGNDFAKAMNLPTDAGAVFDLILTRQVVSVDVGTAQVEGKKIYFCNALGVGFDALSADKASMLKRWLGVAAYRLAVPLSYLSWRKTRFDVAVDGTNVVVDDELLFVAINNGPSSGGGISIAPDADFHDGMFDIIIVKHAGLLRILRILPAAVSGRHITEPEVTVRKGRSVALSCSRGLSVHADGEIVSTSATSLTVSIMPNQLQIFAPSST